MNFLIILSAITCFQLLELGVILLISKQGNRTSNRILSVFMFSNSLLIAWFAFGSRLILDFPFDTFFYFLLAPYLFLYTKSLTTRAYKRNTRELLHWIPAVVSILIIQFFPLSYYYVLISLYIQIAVYIVVIIVRILNYRKEIREEFSSISRIDLGWLLFIFFAFILMWSVDVLGLIFKGGEYFAIVSVSINFIFATALVIRGLRHPKTFTGLKDPKKYSGSVLNNKQVQEYSEQIKEVMAEKKPFLNPDLTVRDLAERINIHPKALSQVINSSFKRNFFDFINKYRIEEAKMIMIKDTHKTVLEVLYQVGYNSKSAFNVAFKKESGMTPTEFRKNRENGSTS